MKSSFLLKKTKILVLVVCVVIPSRWKKCSLIDCWPDKRLPYPKFVMYSRPLQPNIISILDPCRSRVNDSFCLYDHKIVSITFLLRNPSIASLWLLFWRFGRICLFHNEKTNRVFALLDDKCWTKKQQIFFPFLSWLSKFYVHEFSLSLFLTDSRLLTRESRYLSSYFLTKNWGLQICDVVGTIRVGLLISTIDGEQGCWLNRILELIKDVVVMCVCVCRWVPGWNRLLHFSIIDLLLCKAVKREKRCFLGTKVFSVCRVAL